MGDSPVSLDCWREFFQSASCDIFELIEKAIVVAAVDCPNEFTVRKGQIAERLFTSRFSKCFGCNRVELQGPGVGDDAKVEECRSVKIGEKNRCNFGPEDLNRVGVSNYGYDEAEAITDVEEERKLVGDVLWIKDVLCNEQESEAVLYESLKRLQLMQLSVENLQETQVIRAVSGLRKHNSKQIRTLVRTLIEGWKVLVDEWVASTAAIANETPVNISVNEEEDPPSPPKDEEALLSISIQLSKEQNSDGQG